MFLRIAVTCYFIGSLRVFLLHTGLLGLFFDPEKLFSTSAFSQLFSAFFFFSGIIFSSILTQFRECESKVDEAICAFHEFVDAVELALGAEAENEETSTAETPLPLRRKAFIQPARNFLKCWADILNEPPEELKSSNSNNNKTNSNSNKKSASSPASSPKSQNKTNTEKANACLNEMLQQARFSEAPAKAALVSKTSLLSAASLKCVDKFRQTSHRVWTIRRTRVLEPAQIYLNIMLVVVLFCIFFTAWPTTPIFVEFVCITASAACTMLIHQLILELDDPFNTELSGVLSFFGTNNNKQKPHQVNPLQQVLTVISNAVSFLLLIDQRPSVKRRQRRAQQQRQNSADGQTGAFHFFDDEHDNSGIRISVQPIIAAAESRM
jgi:hypothetical protein